MDILFNKLINELQNINFPLNTNNLLINIPEMQKNINTKNIRDNSIQYLVNKSKKDLKGAFLLGTQLLKNIQFENQITYGGNDISNHINSYYKCIKQNILLICILLLFLICLIIYLIKINKNNTNKCLINTDKTL